MDIKAFLSLLRKSAHIFVQTVLILFIFIYLNISSAFGPQFPDVTLFTGQAWRIAIGCGLTFAAMVLLLYFEGKLGDLLSVWRKNFWVVLFLSFSTLSLLWTVDVPSTLYELMLLFFSTFAASYLAVQYQISGFVKIITWIGVCCVLLSLFIVFFTPYGVMMNRPFIGSWRGLFWHRNHAGSLMAFFNMVFLFRILFDGKKMKNQLVFIFFYLLTAVHVFGSRSAAGIIIYLFLNFISLVAWFWLNFRDRIKPKHYYLFAFTLVSGFIVFVSNLGFFFGLFGRSANMTGRTPLWEDLFLNFYLTKPFLGHGYGAIWMQESFRVLMQSRHGWPYQVYFADNGFLDILLNLGATGLVLFLILLFATAYKITQKIRKTYSWEYIFALAILVYVVTGNLAYSFLLEVDHFVWACLIIVAFLAYLPGNEAL